MCTSPGKLANGQTFACRKCTQCRDHYVNDWVGRCIAESKTCRHWHVVTLTYGNEMWIDHRDIPIDQRLQAARLTYSDVQHYLMRLRKSKHDFKFFCVGEYGDKKGRAHWHLIFFWKDTFPDFPLLENCHEKHWPHGFSYWRDGGIGGSGVADAVRYVCKYLAKGFTPGELRKQGKLGMSKKPPIGHDYFDWLADRYVSDRLPLPNPFFYQFADCRRKDGKLHRFHLTRASLDLFVKNYVEAWQDLRGDEEMPASELVQWYLDRKVERVFRPNIRRSVEDAPWFFPPPDFPGDEEDGVFYLDEKLNTYYVLRDDKRLYWSYDEEGQRAWLAEIRTAPELHPQLTLDPARSGRRVSNEYSARKDGTYYATRRSGSKSVRH